MVPAAVPSSRPTPTAATTHFAASEAAGEGPGVTHKPPRRQPTSRVVNTFKSRYRSQSPSTSRSIKTLSGKLENDNHRLLGTRNSSGPSPKFLEPSLSVSPPSPPEASHSEKNRLLINLEIQDMLEKGAIHIVPFTQGNPGSSAHSFGPQKRRWSEASGEPETPEPVPSLRTLQNGRNPHGKGPTKKRRFYGQDRSEGRIFHSSPLSGRSEIYKIHVGRHPLPVCVPPIWPFQRLRGISKDHETSCSSFATTGHPNDHLFGRLAHHGPVARLSKLPCFNGSESPREFRFHHQLSEVTPNPSNSNGIPRHPDRLADNDSRSAKRQSQEGRVPIYAQLCVFDAQKSQRTLTFSCQCVPGTHGSLFLL